MDPASYLSGQLLIALPAIGDTRFERAVALIFAHDAEHAMGLILNHPLRRLTLGGDDGTPRRSRLALGYAGWGPGQLEQELRRNVWLTCPADEAIVFETPPEEIWTVSLGRLGVDPSFLTADAGEA